MEKLKIIVHDNGYMMLMINGKPIKGIRSVCFHYDVDEPPTLELDLYPTAVEFE